MDLETTVYISVGVLGGACALLLVVMLILCVQVSSLKRALRDLQIKPGIRVQKLTMASDNNHAFHNPALSPDEELSKRGYTMHRGSDEDLESGRGTERQTGGQFLEELSREIDQRSRREQAPESTAPRFLLHSIEYNKRKSRSLTNPTAANRERVSDTNPNFIY